MTNTTNAADRKAVTLFFDEELYREFRKYCRFEGWIVSRQIEKLMDDQLKKKRLVKHWED